MLVRTVAYIYICTYNMVDHVFTALLHNTRCLNVSVSEAETLSWLSYHLFYLRFLTVSRR